MNPVEYTGTAVSVVDSFNAQPRDQMSADYWSSPEVNEVRKQIKDHYIAEQHQRCCYCQRAYPTTNNAVWDAEHVIARDSKPQFMFQPLNLAAVCKDCNTAKRDQNVLKNKDRVTLPTKSDDYLIVHPHLDRYEDYILWYDMVVVAATCASTKGQATIAMCKLHRFSQQFGDLKGDIMDQRFRDRVGQLMATRNRQDAEVLLAEVAAHMANLPDR